MKKKITDLAAAKKNAALTDLSRAEAQAIRGGEVTRHMIRVRRRQNRC